MQKFIEYEYDNGKFVKIPRQDIERLMKLPNIKTEDDACWIWCESDAFSISEKLFKPKNDSALVAPDSVI